MICTSLCGKTLEQLLDILDDPFVEMAEIRLDLCPELSQQDVRDLFETCEKPLVATYRESGKDWTKASLYMETACEAGAKYLDLSIDAPVNVSQAFRKIAAKYSVELIRSYHNFEETPSDEYLDQVAQRCLRYGADIIKIVTTAKDDSDIARLWSLYGKYHNIVAFALGENGSRRDCIEKGAPFTYACYDTPTAPFQTKFDELHALVYGVDSGSFFRTGLRVPCSKSIAQRAILCAALAQGTSHLRGYTPCEDSESAIAAAKALGATVSRRGDTLSITGIGPVSQPLGLESVNAGESGLLARLLIPLLSQMNGGAPFTVEGKKTLLNRPLAMASDIMAAFGVMVRNSGKRDGKEVYVPLSVRGSLIPGLADIPGQGGSQLISGLLMALPLNPKPSKVYVGEPKSLPYMFITLDILRAFGIEISTELEGNAQMLELQDWSYCTGVNFAIKGGARYKAADLDLEADWSAAANFLVAGAVFGSAEVEGLDTGSVQGDISILDILVDAGAAVSYDETVVSVRKAPLSAFKADLSNSPDLFPIVAVLAAFCQGRSILSGVGRLRAKECDRAGAILEMLTGMGVEVVVEGDEMRIEGENYARRCASGHLLRSGKFSSHSDHRMVMALRVASIGADGEVEIDNRECVRKSFPDFFDMMV